MYRLLSVRHSWPEQAGIKIKQTHNDDVYTFLHFYNSVDILINDQIITTRPHACILYSPGVQQHYCCKASLLYDWFHFSGEVTIPEGLQCNTVFYPGDHTYITAIIQEAEKEFYTQKVYKQTIIDIKLRELFIKLSREEGAVPSPAIDKQTKQIFQSLRNDIVSHPEKPISITDIIKKTYLSSSRFHSIYRSLYGRSPREDLIFARIQAAANELVNTTKTITQIAEELGYSSPSHFSRQFQMHTGMNPGEYRKKGNYYAEK